MSAARNAPEPESSSGRRCGTCGRVLDREEHEYLGRFPVENPITGRIRHVKQWRCRVRLVAHRTAPVLGDPKRERKSVGTYVPNSPHRTRENLTAFVPIAILQAREEHG